MLTCLYNNAIMLVLVQEHSSKAIHLKRGVRQGDVISINQSPVHHSPSACRRYCKDLSTILEGLNQVSQEVDLKINMDMTKIMCNAHVVPTPISVGNSILEVVEIYVYLGQTV